MAKQTVNNGESGLVVRNKLNDNFTELYDGFGFDTPIQWASVLSPVGTAARGFRDTAPSPHPNQAWASLNVEARAPGSGKNGPDSSDYAGVFSVIKNGYAGATRPPGGEIDGLKIFVRQDGPTGLPSQDPGSSDCAAILIGAENVLDCGFIAAFEAVTSNLDPFVPGGAKPFQVRTQIGVLDMNGGTQNKFGFGAIADAGVITSAFTANTSGTGSFINILTSPGVTIAANGDYGALNSFWPAGAWFIARTAPENGTTVFRHRGTGSLLFECPESGAIFSTPNGVSINTSGFNAAGPTAVLELNSTTRGFLPPRMTTTQRDAIGSPPNGLQIYNTTTDKMQVRAAGSWVDLH
jgi:hypothetical protein